MKITLALTLDKDVQSKANLVHDLFKDINEFVAIRDYGKDLHDLFIICRIINPPIGFEHLYKDFKPKFIEYKSLINKLTGEPFVIERQFSYCIKIQGKKFKDFIAATEIESKKILGLEILSSLSNFDKLTTRVKDFDKEKFKADMQEFLGSL